MAKELPKIKPCPFCGGKRTTTHDFQDAFSINCARNGCWVTGPMKPTKQDAIEAWNRAPRAGE